jgi:hypothetical protein
MLLSMSLRNIKGVVFIKKKLFVVCEVDTESHAEIFISSKCLIQVQLDVHCILYFFRR